MEAVLTHPSKRINYETRVIPISIQSDRKPTFKQLLSETGKLIVPVRNGFDCIPFDELIYLRAHGNYTEVHTGVKMILLSKTLKSLLVQLPENQFYRIHNSYLVNIFFIKSYCNTATDPHLILEDDTCIPVSRSKKSLLR